MEIEHDKLVKKYNVIYLEGLLGSSSATSEGLALKSSSSESEGEEEEVETRRNKKQVITKKKRSRSPSPRSNLTIPPLPLHQLKTATKKRRLPPSGPPPGSESAREVLKKIAKGEHWVNKINKNTEINKNTVQLAPIKHLTKKPPKPFKIEGAPPPTNIFSNPTTRYTRVKHPRGKHKSRHGPKTVSVRRPQPVQDDAAYDADGASSDESEEWDDNDYDSIPNLPEATVLATPVQTAVPDNRWARPRTRKQNPSKPTKTNTGGKTSRKKRRKKRSK